MHTIIEEILGASARLCLPVGAISLLPEDESQRVYLSALHRFVGIRDRRWWWEAFREPGVSAPFASGDGWRKLPFLVPSPSDRVWLIAEDDQLPQYPVFDTTAEVASEVIGDCYAFEYYLIAKDLSWLVCENHHNVVCAVGSAVESKLLENAVSQEAPPK